MPTTVDEFEQVLIAFRDNAASIKAEYGIDGDIIPMSCIVNNGDQDPSILINGFGEGYGDADKDRHIAVTNDRKVICVATQQGYRDGLDWLHKLYAEKLIDPECFTQEWSTYVSKGKAGRYGVCFSWDVANIDNLTDWEPLPALTADTRNITPQNGSFTSGFAPADALSPQRRRILHWFAHGWIRCTHPSSLRRTTGVLTAMRKALTFLNCPPTIRASPC